MKYRKKKRVTSSANLTSNGAKLRGNLFRESRKKERKLENIQCSFSLVQTRPGRLSAVILGKTSHTSTELQLMGQNICRRGK